MRRTYRDVYTEGIETLREVFPEQREVQLDARLLLEAACGTDTQTLLANPDRIVSEKEYSRYREFIAERSKRVPVAYILGDQDFMGLTFTVNSHVLIPEQDTENLVEEALSDLTGGTRILDLCTGSGCIILSLLKYSKDTIGVATDLSARALEVAIENARKLELNKRVTFLQGDLFQALDEVDVQKFDLIISNPPYIPTAVIETLAPEVRVEEPRMALDGGEDGLLFYRRIITEAPKYLSIGGTLMLEIGYDQAGDVTALLEEQNYYDIKVFQDYGGNDRVVRAVRSIHQ